jgi:hypothetical protein
MKNRLLASGLSLAAAALFAGCGSNPEGSGFPDSGFEPDGAPRIDLDASTPVDGDSAILFKEGGAVFDGASASCAKGEATASREAAYLLFILDGSGSMSSSNKWTAATGAIDAIFGDMKTKADPGIGAGLIVFSDTQDPNLGCGFGACTYPSSRDVGIGFVDQGQLTKLTGRTASPVQPNYKTPTGTALTGGYASLSAYQPTAPLLPGGKKVVVLITDGVPTDTCKTVKQDGTDDYTQNECVKMAATRLAAAAPGGPLQTFVIGVGGLPGDFKNFDAYFLGALAKAGGSAPASCNPKENSPGASDYCYFAVDPSGSSTATQQAFEKAINDIRGQVSSCTLAIGATDAGVIDPTKVNVKLNGTTVLKDPVDGWSYDDPAHPTSVTLHGASCATLKNDPNAKVSIELGCISEGPH